MVRKLGPLALVGAVAITVAAACGPPGTTRFVDRIFATATATRAVRYATAPDLVTGAPVELRLDAFQPGGDTAASRPALIWVHGGGFLAGDRTGTNQIATEYAQRGYVTFSIDYRLDPDNRCAELQAGIITNPTEKARETARCRAAIAAAQHDAQAVVRWVRGNAAAYRVDPSRIAMGGFSAGAITALNVGYRSDDPGNVGDFDANDSRIQAAISASGCTDLPQAIGPGDAPAYLLHAEWDPYVYFSCAKETADWAHAAGLVADTMFFPNDPAHADLLYALHKSDVDAAWTAFLVRQLGL